MHPRGPSLRAHMRSHFVQDDKGWKSNVEKMRKTMHSIFAHRNRFRISQRGAKAPTGPKACSFVVPLIAFLLLLLTASAFGAERTQCGSITSKLLPAPS